MGSARSGTKQKSIDALLFFIEMDTAEPVIEEMLPFLKHRTPKVVAGTANALTEIVRQYGSKTIPCKPIFQSLPSLFGHADKNVRAAAQALSIELYRWLGDGFKDVLFPDLKPVQQKDLEAEFEKVKADSPKQERYLRSQKELMDRQQANGIAPEGGEAADEDEDVEMDLYDPVEILSKIPSNFNTQITSSKWKERKEALEELLTIVNQPKIQDADYSDLMRTLAKCMKDANIQVVALAANSIECMAKGLRTGFAKYQPTVLSPMLERLKEKKQSVSDSIGAALDAVYQSTSLSDILEETLDFLKHKTPQVKIETAKFVSRCLSTTKTIPKPAEIKSIIEHSIKLLSDTQEPVRSGGAQILGIVMKIIGERAMTPFLESVDDIKKNKIKEWYEKAEVKAKPGKPTPLPAAAPPPASSAPRGAPPSRGGPAGRGLPLRKRAAPPSSPGTVPATRLKSEDPGSLTSASASRPKPGLLNTNGLPNRRPILASPTKSRAPVFGAAGSASLAEQTTGPSQQSSVSGRSSAAPPGRGLTGRPLAAQGRAMSPIDSGLTAQERQELEKLKSENNDLQKKNEQLQWQVQGFNTEKTHLLAEINILKEKNAKLIEEHTRDILSIKSRDTQLTRSQSDLESSRLRINQIELELDDVRQQLMQERSTVRLLQSQIHNNSGMSGSTSPIASNRQVNSANANRSGGNGYGSAAGIRSPNRPTSLYGSPLRQHQSLATQDWQQHASTPQRVHHSPMAPVQHQTPGYGNHYEQDFETSFGTPAVGEDTIMDGAEELEHSTYGYDSQVPITTQAMAGDRSSVYGGIGLSNRQYLPNNTNNNSSNSINSLGSNSSNGGSGNGMNRNSRIGNIPSRSGTSTGNYSNNANVGSHIRSQSSLSRADSGIGGLGIRPGYGGAVETSSEMTKNDHVSSSSRLGEGGMYGGLRFTGSGNTDQWQKTSQIAENLKQRIQFLKKRADASKLQFDSDEQHNGSSGL